MTAHSGNKFEESFPYGNSAFRRRLYVNFDNYTDGDQDFKRELGTQVIDNIQELRQSLFTAVRESNPEVFLKVSHKVKLTLEMLNDVEFSNIIKELEKDLGNNDHSDGSFAERTKHFEDICQSIIKSLTIEIFGKVA